MQAFPPVVQQFSLIHLASVLVLDLVPEKVSPAQNTPTTNRTPVYFTFQLTSPSYIFLCPEYFNLTSPTPEYFSLTLFSPEYFFNFSGLIWLSGLQQSSSVALFTSPSITSTNFCTRIPRQMSLCREIREGVTDGSQ